MIDKLHKLIQSLICEEDIEVSEEEEKQLAIYGILFEAARSDHHVAQEEQDKIREIIERYFKIDDDAFEKLKAKAEKLRSKAQTCFS